MKAEHRKELHTNALAHRVGRALEGIKAGPSRNTLLLSGLALLVMVLVATWYFLHLSSQATNSALWMEWSNIDSADQLQEFARKPDVQGTNQGRLARFKLARLHLPRGLRNLGSLRGPALEDIKVGAQTYEQLVGETRDLPILQQEALLGAAKGYEALGDLAKARDFYKQLAGGHPDSDLGKDAARQLERLHADEQDLKALTREYRPEEGKGGS
jgi:hypothetical protein